MTLSRQVCQYSRLFWAKETEHQRSPLRVILDTFFWQPQETATATCLNHLQPQRSGAMIVRKLLWPVERKFAMSLSKKSIYDENRFFFATRQILLNLEFIDPGQWLLSCASFRPLQHHLPHAARAACTALRKRNIRFVLL